MEEREEKRLKLLGGECFGEPIEIKLTQSLGNHTRLSMLLWKQKQTAGDPAFSLWHNRPVSLVWEGKEEEPVFSGLITFIRFFRRGGRQAIEVKAMSYTLLLDQEKKRRSFQQEKRTCGELFELLLSPHGGACLWEGEEKNEPVGKMLMQYEETDWAFLKRVAAGKKKPLVVEGRFPRACLFVGLPSGGKERELKAEQYQRKISLAGERVRGDNKEEREAFWGLEVVVEKQREEYHLGERVRLQGSLYAIAGKESCLVREEWLHTYNLRGLEACKVEPRGNPCLAGAAVRGQVVGTNLTGAQLSLETDGEGEAADSWHSRPVYYAGGGKGYSGQPEKGDIQYLYFPTPWEDSRYILGGTDAGGERLLSFTGEAMRQAENSRKAGEAGKRGTETGSPAGGGSSFAGRGSASPVAATTVGSGGSARTEWLSFGGESPLGGVGKGEERQGEEVTPQSLPRYKQWVTPGYRSLILGDRGIYLSNGVRGSLQLTGEQVLVNTRGSLTMECTEEMVFGKQVSLEAGNGLWASSARSSLFLTPEAVQLESPLLELASPLSELVGILGEDEVDKQLSAYEEEKKAGPVLVAADGSLVQPDGYNDILYSEENWAYFREKVLGTEGYVMENPNSEGRLFTNWLTEVYGKNRTQKFMDYICSLDGLQTGLDVVGMFIPGVDAVNAFIYFVRGDYASCILTMATMGPAPGAGIKKLADGGLEYMVKTGQNLMELGGRTSLNVLEVGGRYIDDLAGKGIQAVKKLELVYEAGAEQMAKLKHLLKSNERAMEQLLELYDFARSGENLLDKGFKLKAIVRGLDDTVEGVIKYSDEVVRYTDEMAEVSRKLGDDLVKVDLKEGMPVRNETLKPEGTKIELEKRTEDLYSGEEWYKYLSDKYGYENVEWVSQKPTGEDWRRYFIDKYGYENVEWNAADRLLESGINSVDDIFTAGKKVFDNFDINNAYVKPKHLSTTGGNGQKFIGASKAEAESILKDALSNGKIVSISDNGLTKAGNASYEIIIDAGKTVGTKGENLVKIVISSDGGMLSAYPIK